MNAECKALKPLILLSVWFGYADQSFPNELNRVTAVIRISISYGLKRLHILNASITTI